MEHGILGENGRNVANLVVKELKLETELVMSHFMVENLVRVCTTNQSFVN